MELLGAAIQALLRGLDVRDIIALILVCIVVAQLQVISRELGGTNARLEHLAEKIDEHGAHQTSRMAEIRNFMINWWERFGTFESAQARHRRRTTDASQDDLSAPHHT